MSKNLDVGIRITADGRVLITEIKAAQAALSQIGETAKKSNNESAAAAERFTANLKRQADTLGMTATQIRAYDAAQLKLNEAQRASVEASNRAIAAYEKNQAAARANVDVLGSLKGNLIAAAGAYVSYTAVMAGGKAIIDTALANERLNNTLKVATGSTEGAARETAFLRQETEKLGLQFTITAEQYAKLAAASKGTQLEGQATRDIFLGIAKASTVLNLSADQTGGALLAVQQMISKGTVAAEELRGQLGERLPGAFQMAARALGVTTSELDKMLIKGEVTAERLLPSLALELEKTFGPQAQEAAQGLNAKINRLDNSFTDLKTAIGNTGLLDLLADGIVLATRFTDALSGAKVLSAVDQQTQRIAAMRDELASLNNRRHIPVIGDLIFDKRQADLLEQRIEDGVADLNKLQKAATEASEAVSGKATITPGAKPALPEKLAQEREQSAKAEESAAKRSADAKAREAQQALESSKKIIDALKRETQEIGLNSIQKKMLSAAAEAAKAPTKELAAEIMASAQAWSVATQQQEALMAAEKERAKGLAEMEKSAQDRARAEQQAAQQVRQEWRNTWGQVEQNAKTAFIQFAAHGKSAMQSIGEAIKFSIIDVLYQLTLRKWIINVGTSLEGVLAGGGSSGGGTLNSLFNGAGLINAGKAIYNGFSSGLSGAGSSLVSGLGRMLGSSAIQAFGSGMAGIGATGASTAAFSTVGGAGTAFIGGAGTAIGGTGMGAAASMGSMVAAAAGPLAVAAIADVVFRMLAGNKSTGSKVLDSIPVIGSLGALLFGHGPMKFRQQVAIGTASDEGFDGRVTDVFRAKGGLFVSNKHREQAAGNQAELLELFNTTITGFSTSAKQFADNLGLSRDAITGYSKEIRLESEKGKTLTDEAIQGMLASIGDDFARGLVPSIDELSKSGESAYQTLTRLNTEFTTLVDAATLLGNSVAQSRQFMLGSTSFEGRTAFVDAAGGLDALTQKAQFFAANFLTDAQRLAPVQERLNDELNRLGLSTEFTKDQFGALVQSFGHVNGISEEMLQALLNLAPAFIQVRDASQQAAEAAKLQSLTLLSGAFNTLQRSVNAERERITNNYNESLEKVNGRIQDVSDSIGKLKSLSEALKATVSTLRPLSTAQAKQQIQDAIDAAKSGKGLPEAESLRDALGVLGQKSTSGFSSSFEFAREQAKTANLVGELGSLTNAQLTLEERSLAALEAQRDRLTDGFRDQTKRLDSLLEQGQREIETLNGLDTSIVSLTQAIGLLNLRSIQAGGGASIIDPLTGEAPVSGNPDISDKQIRDFVNTPGRTEMQIYNAAKQNGVSFAQYAAATGAKLEDLQAWAKKNNLPTFASGGFHRGGLRIVGEHGPELEFTGPSRISSNNDLSRMLNNDSVVVAIYDLIEKIKENNTYNQRVANKLDAVTHGGNALRIKELGAAA